MNYYLIIIHFKKKHKKKMKVQKDYKAIFSSIGTSTNSQTEKQVNIEREEFGLSLRKKKMNNFLMKKREKNLEDKQTNNLSKSPYEIIPENLALSEEIKNKKYNSPSSFIDSMIILLNSKNINENKFAIYNIRQQILRKDFPIEQMYNRNIVDKLMYILYENINSYDIIYEVTWSLINFSIKVNNVNLMIFLTNKGCIQIYIKIFDYNDKYLTENVLWLISNCIIGCEIAMENLFLTSIIRNYILQFIEVSNMNFTIQKICVRILSSFTLYLNSIYKINQIDHLKKTFLNDNIQITDEMLEENINYLEEHFTSIFIKYLNDNINDEEIINDCLYGLSFLSNSLNLKVHKLLLSSGIIIKIIRKEINYNKDFYQIILQILGNLFSNFTGTIDESLIEEINLFLLNFLKMNEPNIKREVLWTLSNLLCLPNVNIQNIINSGIIPYIIQSLTKDKNNIGIEALYILGNILEHDDYVNVVISFAKNIEIIKILISVINKFYDDYIAIQLILDMFNKLFEIGKKYSNLTQDKNIFLEEFQVNGGNSYLEKLQGYKNQEVYNSLENILRIYFNTTTMGI